MHTFAVDDLRRILRISAGEDGSNPLDGDILDVTFAELGYDSLALLEMTSRVEREFGMSIPDGVVADLPTPRAYLGYVNERLGAGV
jgi:act minimal PKS acyl carrier protein